MRMVYARDHGGTRNVSVPRPDRERFCIDDAEVLKLADYAIKNRGPLFGECRASHADGHRMGQGR